MNTVREASYNNSMSYYPPTREAMRRQAVAEGINLLRYARANKRIVKVQVIIEEETNVI